jgi:hypothetical protein
MDTLGFTQYSATLFLKNLKVPTMYLGNQRYFLLTTLEEALFAALEGGGPGFAAPNSSPKRSCYDANAATTLPDKLFTRTEKTARARRLDLLKRQSKKRRKSRAQKALKTIASEPDTKKKFLEPPVGQE